MPSLIWSMAVSEHCTTSAMARALADAAAVAAVAGAAQVSPAAALQVELQATDDIFDPFDNDFVRLDFKPLYQAIHIFKFLDRAAELASDFEEQRRLQAILFLSPNFSITSAGSSAAALENFLEDVIGFFVIEKHIIANTTGFRSRASVDLMWETTTSNIYKLIENALSESTDPGIYFQIKKTILRFAQVLRTHNYGYSLTKIMELMSTVFERYCDVTKTSCAQEFVALMEDGHDAQLVVVTTQEELNEVVALVPGAMAGAKSVSAASGSTRKLNEDARAPGAPLPPSSFPMKMPFTKLVLQCSRKTAAFLRDFYDFAHEFHIPYSASDVDDILKKTIDNVFIRYINQPMVAEAENSNSLEQVLQLFVDAEYAARVCELTETRIEKMRLAPTTMGRTTLLATADFRRACKTIERRIFELLHIRIDDFLSRADYDFVIATPATKLPALYLRDLVNFLTNVMFSTLDSLAPEVKSFMYFDVFDHIAEKIFQSFTAPSVRRMSPTFIEHFNEDLQFLEKYVLALADPNLGDAFLQLRQLVNLMLCENPMDYLDGAIFNRRYNRLKGGLVLDMFEKLNNGTGLFSGKVDKSKKKGYESIIAALKKRGGTPQASPMSGGSH